MARTHKTIRGYIDRIIYIRKQLAPALATEIAHLAKKLGSGAHRSSDHPGVMIQVAHGRTTGGTTTNWKGVVDDLSTKYHIPLHVILMLKGRHTTRQARGYRPKWSASVTVDRVKTPKKLVA